MRDSSVYRNEGDGFRIDSGSVNMHDSTAVGNGRNGIRVRDSAPANVIQGCTVSENGNSGIIAGTAATVIGNSVYSNGDDGIEVSAGSVVRSNAVYQNGDAAADHQIQATSTSLVTHNTVWTQSGAGFAMELGISGTKSSYGYNLIQDSGVSQWVTGGFDIGGNVCNGDSANCP